MKQKVVINTCYGGFGLSEKAQERMKELGFIGDIYNIPRTDPLLISVVEELGELADGNFAKLKIVEVPVDVRWKIQEYDGVEWVAELHRVWE